MDYKVITMPGRDDMMKRLTSVMDDPHAVERLYPLVCRMADKELASIGVTLGLTLAIHDYAEGMPAVIGNIVLRFVPRFLEVLIDDEQARQEAIDHFDSAMASSKS